MAKQILILLCSCIYALQVVAENQENFYPFGEDPGDDYLRQENDIASPAIDLKFGIPFYNKKYWKIFVNDNGVLSFDNEYTRYDGPQPVFPIGPDLSWDQERNLIAPFWGNVDTSNGVGYVYYRQTTEPDLLDRASAEIHRGFVEWDDFQAKALIIATWMEVGFYGMAEGYNLRNSFQCIVATDGFETFAILIYDQIDWTTGIESNGGPENGVGGTPAQVGFNAGDGAKSFSHQYSRDGYFLRNLIIDSNIEVAGVWVYYISSPSVDIAGCTTAGEVKTFPRYDSMLGHQFLYIQGPCFTPDDDIWMQFGPVEDPIALIKCTWMSAQRAWCVVPTFFQVGRLETRVSLNGANTFPYTGEFDVVDIGDVPPGIKRIDPQSEFWMLANRAVVIEWDPSLFNDSLITIDILTYSETDGEPSWEETDNIALNAENTGRYEWISCANVGITSDNAIGVIRITRGYERSQFAIWSDVHWLGYMMNDEFQQAPSDYSNQQCEIWNEEMNNEPVWNHDQDLNPCPCDLSQALADRAQFRPYDFCDMSNAGLNDTEDYCFLRDGIRHCVINIINSPENADSVCCYDFEENLVYAGDSFSGSFSHRWTINGVPPYNAPRAVPVLSTLINDIVPYYLCCVWGDLCEFYQDHRPTRDCRSYDSPRMAVVFGDPHFVTFDGVEYSFNGKGEWTLMRSTTEALNRFTLQARTEQMPDWKGDIVQATRLTSVAMKEDNHANIEVQLSDRTILQVVYQGEYLKIDRQTRLAMDGFYLTFPKRYEGGNLTQVIITFQDSKIGVVINGTAEGMFIQVVIPEEFKGHVEGLLGNWNDTPEDDLTANGGTLVNTNASTEVIYNQFGKTWEINPVNSLFLYDQGQNHDYFQDNDFEPAFLPPNGSLPSYLDSEVIADTCDGNMFCIYDIQSTGLLQLGKATKKAFDDYKQAQTALRDKLFITPSRSGMMGGELIYLYGPSCSSGLTCVFTYDNEIIQTVTATIIDSNDTYCVPDPFFLVGEVSITVVKEGQSIANSPSTTYSLIESGRVDPTVIRQDSYSSIWDTTGNTLTITWTEDEENFGSSDSALTISVLAYREDDPGPRWEEVYVITDGTADDGSYTFTPTAQSDVTADNAFGVIRITGNAEGRQRVLWSDIHPLGYLLEESYQDSPVQWSSEKCQQWITTDDGRSGNFLENLPPCPCTLDQAEQDVGTFITDPTCYPGGGTDTCSKNEGAVHCFLSSFASPPTMSGTKCCYDSNGLLMHSGDTKYAGMSGLCHVRGSSPYRQRNLVPELSHWTNDVIAKYFCCEWSRKEDCFEYVKRRPTTDCVEYEPPNIALSFGDPHFITMDRYNFTFNGLGEYTILRYATSGAKTGAFDFELQGRQVRSADQAGNQVDVTQVSAVAMKDNGSDTIFIEVSVRTGHGGMDVYRKGVDETDMWQSVSFSGQNFTDLQGCTVGITQTKGEIEIHGVVITFRETGISVHVTYDYGMLAVRPILPATLESNHLFGLLGNMDGDPSNDLERRDSNTPLDNPSDEEIFQFGQSWEIESDYNLFRYAGTEHSDYHDTSFVPLMNVAPTPYPPCNFVTQCLFDYEVSKYDHELAMATLGAFEAFESSSENIQKIDACPYLITPLNGSKTYSSDSNKYFEGAQVTFSCTDAILVGSAFRTCVYSAEEEGLVWAGSEEENECFVSPCGVLDTPVNGSISLSDDGLTATFACNEGLTVSGPSESVCQDGEWTNGSPTCVYPCSILDAPANGSISFSDDGLTATFACDEGFTMSGSSESVCQDGEWTNDPPTCIVYPCGTLDAPANGSLSYSDDGLTATFTCDEGFTMSGSSESVCQDGEWTNDPPTCVYPCGTLDAPANGFISFSDDGLTATFACDEGFTMSGSSESVCQDGEWTNDPPTCIANCLIDPDDNKALIIALSVVSSLLAIVLVANGVFFFNHYRQKSSLNFEKQEPKEAKFNQGMEFDSPVTSGM